MSLKLAGFGIAEPVPNLCRTYVEPRCRTTPYNPRCVRHPFGTGLRTWFVRPTPDKKNMPPPLRTICLNLKTPEKQRASKKPGQV